MAMQKCVDSLRFVEIMKNTDKFVKGDILQVACITDKEVDVVHHMAVWDNSPLKCR